MKTGTKSLLFGVHQFILHPLLVALAWRLWHGKWPKDLPEWVAILVHDWGYWGCEEMDEGRGADHPAYSAQVAARFFPFNKRRRDKVVYLVRGHSRTFTRAHHIKRSPLYAPDKLSILFEWRWLYLVRGMLSGEVWEYISRSPQVSPWAWVTWYKNKTWSTFYTGDWRKRKQYD